MAVRKDERTFAQLFREAFSQTFPGGLLYINKELQIIEISHKLLMLLKVKNRDGISLSKESMLDKGMEALFKFNKNDHLFKYIKKEAVQTIQKLKFERKLMFSGKLYLITFAKMGIR